MSSTIICEVGHNHCGDMSLAKELICRAKEFGGDLVKFSLYDSKELGYPGTELSKDQAFMLFNYGKKVGIEVFFSVYDVKRVKWCEEMGVKRYKIGCRMRDAEVLKAVAKTQKEIIISADHHHCIGDPRINAMWLFCISEYPAQLTWMPDFEEESRFVGFSDHTIGLDACKIALSRGAEIIEKHFAINHQMGIDAEWSMTYPELKELRRFADVVQACL